ncbi:MAG: PQQ-binding-like beta-propeller repeat protein [Gemmatimonadetes bacterium]|nr:PQQ-binding-like beta-propeller repeat protein [Gemmatimonadota bacterium]
MTRWFMTRGPIGTAVLAILLMFPPPSHAQQGPARVRGNAPGEWRVWGADAWSTRYSPLDQINASNFNSLEVAWQWNAGQFGEDEYYRTTPLYANGRLFTVATTRRGAMAINPATGETLWKWMMDEGIRWQKAPRQFAGRGLTYWTDGREERVIVVTPGYHLASLDAKTGTPDPKFGKNGIVDLMDGLGLPLVPLAVDDSGPLIISDAAPYRQARPGETWDPVTQTGADGTMGIDPAYGQIANSSPAIMVNDVIVVGNSSIHGYYPIRVRNLPVVYIPVGMPLLDEYGGHRPGDNLFGNSLVAIDATTGQRKWHFQMVHHDIWDYDTPMAPNLLDVNIDGRPRKIIAQTTKQGWMYVFDRVTGEPIWPIVETPVLQSEVPGEQTSATQPIPTKPAPYAHQGLEEEDVIDYTPAIKDSALKIARQCRMGPYYIPASPTDGTAPSGYRCSWYAPGASGGVNIDGGAAVDPETGMMYVGSQSGLSVIRVQKDPCSEFRYSSPRDNCGLLGALPPPPGYTPPSGGRGGGFEGRAGISNIGGVSILKPKQLGGITAYDLKTGEKAWWIPNGTMVPVTSNAPLFAGVNLPPQPGRGQAQIIATKTLLIYGTGRNGQDNPPQLYAVDKATGKPVGAVKLPSRTTAMPMTFMHEGRQYIVFATGAGANTALVALRLPKQ